MNPLKLQILLGAVDKLTAPLKAVSGQSRLTAKDLVDTKKRIRELEAQSGQIDGYRTLGQQIGATRAQLTAAQRDAQLMAQQFAKVEQPTKAMTRAMEQAKQKVRDLSQQEREMVARHGSLKRAMGEAGISTKQLGQHQRQLKSDLAAANSQLDQQRAKLGQLADQQKRMNQVKANYRQTQELRGQMAGHGAGAIAAGTAIGMPVYSAIKDYSSFEDAMKGVAKQVDGARDSAGQLTPVYFRMSKQMKDLAEELPMQNGAIDFAALTTGGARMGVQGEENLIRFAKTNAMASKAFEEPAEKLAEDLGKIANLYKIPISEIEGLGDAINYLDDNAQSKGGDIIDVLQRLGGVADKLDYKKAAALGSTFLSLGTPREVAASASNAMVRELSIATMQSKTFQAGMAAIGMKSADIEKAMTNDAMGTILKVLDKIKAMKAEDQLRVTTQLFGKEFGDDASKLANNLPELRRQLALVNEEKAKGSMRRESEIDKDSLSSQWLLLQAGIANVKTSLGQLLRGSLMDIIGYIKETVKVVRGWVEVNPELANTLVKVAAVTSIIAIALGGLSLTIAALLGPMAIMKLIFGVLGVTFGGMLGAIGALLAPLAALAALGIAIIKFWQPISAFFSGLWQGIMTGLAPVFEAFKPFAPLLDGIGSGVKALSGWFGDLLEPIKFSKETLEGFGSAGELVGRILGEAFNLALTPLKAFLKGIEWLLESLGILEAKKLPSFQLEAPTASTPGYLNGNYGQTALAGGYSYGPRIAPTPVPKPVAAKGGNSTTSHHWTIVQQPGETPDDLVRKIDQRLDQRDRQAAARGRATLGDIN